MGLAVLQEYFHHWVTYLGNFSICWLCESFLLLWNCGLWGHRRASQSLSKEPKESREGRPSTLCLYLVVKHWDWVWIVLVLNLWQLSYHLLETQGETNNTDDYYNLVIWKAINLVLHCVFICKCICDYLLCRWNSGTFYVETHYFSWRSVCS